MDTTSATLFVLRESGAPVSSWIVELNSVSVLQKVEHQSKFTTTPSALPVALTRVDFHIILHIMGDLIK